jgi:ABC-type polysaccharide transport system permease subunit
VTNIQSHQQWAIILAGAGLLPFLAFTLLALFGVELAFAQQGLSLYSFGILSFLAGSWWGFALLIADVSNKQRSHILLLSNSIVLAGLAALMILPALGSVIVLGLLHPLLLAAESSLAGLRRQPRYYRDLRVRSTMGAFGAHVLVVLSSVSQPALTATG